MADQVTKIDHENHLLLDQSLIRLPHELLRKNFRSAHIVVERDKEAIKKQIKEATIKGINGTSSTEDVLKSLDVIIARSKKLKSKLDACQAEESRLFQQTEARIHHLAELHTLRTLEDVKYEVWSRARLDRLLVDYFLRQGYHKTARELASEKNMTDLVDIETFDTMFKIQTSLRKGRTVVEALAWCSENKKELRKINSGLEFSLRFQQYIELVRLQTPESLLQAIIHAKRFLHPYQLTYTREVIQAAGILAFSPRNPGSAAYQKMFSEDRWDMLANLFIKTHNELLALSSIPLLHVALSSGLSALKTPACHSHYSCQGVTNSDGDVDMTGPLGSGNGGDGGQEEPAVSSVSNGSSNGGINGNQSNNVSSIGPDSYANGRMCPICSAELNELARSVPYAHHSKSHVDHDLMLLPNGRVYGLQRLLEHARNQGLEPGKVKDLRGSAVYNESELTKVYIT